MIYTGGGMKCYLLRHMVETRVKEYFKILNDSGTDTASVCVCARGVWSRGRLDHVIIVSSHTLIRMYTQHNSQSQINMLVPYGAAIYALSVGDSEAQAAADGIGASVAPGTFWFRNKQLPLLPLSSIDLLPGDVYSVNLEGNELKPKKIFSIYDEPGTVSMWTNNAHDDPSMVLCLKMETGYGDAGDVFSAPFGIRLPDQLRGEDGFAGVLTYEVGLLSSF